MKTTKQRIRRIIAFYLAINILFEVISPTMAYALTAGPGQPEMASFEPVGTTEMVDPFTGDFNYNIPLLTVPGPNGGYPVNLAYHAGIGMDDEASWVGLGWNINPGVISRDVRGLPDDFKGDNITKMMNVNPNKTVNLNFGIPFFSVPEFWGFKWQQNMRLGMVYNNYQGIGFAGGFSLTSKGKSLSSKMQEHEGSLGISMNYNSLSGETDLVPSMSLKATAKKAYYNFGLSFHINSLSRLKDMNFSSSISRKHDFKKVNYEYSEHGHMEMGVDAPINMQGGAMSAGTSFASSSFVPHSEFPQTGFSIGTNFSFGGDIGGTYNSFAIDANYSVTKNKPLAGDVLDMSGYGYLYTDSKGPLNDGEEDFALLDFNREKDAVLSKDIPSMAAPIYTYDLYSIKGQGIGGVFRPYRTDISLLTDAVVRGEQLGGSFGGEVGAGVPFHFGMNLDLSYSKSYTGRWRNSDLWNEIKNKTQKGSFYFKSPSDLAANFDEETDRNMLDQAFPITAMVDFPEFVSAPSIQDLEDEFNPHAEFRVNNSGIANKTNYANRRAVSQMMSYKTVDELGKIPGYKHAWVDRRVYPVNSSPRSYDNSSNSFTYQVPNHHLGEISVVNPDGNRYIYGLPAVNTTQKEVTFSVDVSASGHTVHNDKIVDYILGSGSGGTGDGDNSMQNQQLDDHFFSMTQLPAYVHSYMLTAIVSPDYVDLTGDGPSDDDFGYWVKFNYSRASSQYNWRMPFNGANFLKGYLSTGTDDKAGYTYGEKELWYLNSIETKSHIAEFTLMNRKDAYGVSAEDVNYDGNGHIDASGGASKALEKITLYAKNDPNGTPLKVVHFEYSQDLCKNIWNSDNFSGGTGDGKLTLKKVWFSYMGNEKGQLSPYQFDYYETSSASNPNYDILKEDRWGNYKNDNYGVDNTIYPYTYQKADYNGNGTIDVNDDNDRNRNASAWNLREITLPSGGKIVVDYEADDYAYVHAQDAMEMVKIAGFGPSSTSMSVISDGGGYISPMSSANEYMFFELDNPSMGDADVGKCVAGIDDIYFKVYVDLKKNGIEGIPKKDYVIGYAGIDNNVYGTYVESSSGIKYGYVKLKKVGVKDRPANVAPFTNPIRKAAWQYLKLERRDILFPASNNNNSTGGLQYVKQVANSVIGMFQSQAQLFLGYYNYCYTSGLAKNMSFDKPSFIRLKSHDGIKYGGGYRVKQIAITDTWKETYNASTNPTGEQASSYGQTYSYRLADGRSSGVAAYEPLVGGEEIPYRKPIRYSSPYFIFKNQNLYMEEPIGESYYPAPIVGYSRVIVKNIDQTDASSNPVTKTREGTTVYEFYTTKDFPFHIKPSNVLHEKFRPKIPIPFVGSVNFENHAFSQWMDVVTNDMHGRGKSVSTYAAGVNVDSPMALPISKSEYFYNTTATYNPSGENSLNSTVKVLFGDAYYKDANLGITREDFIDMRENSGMSLKYGMQTNMEYTYPALIVINGMPIVDYAESMFKSIVGMHVTNQTGILMETRNYNEGSVSSAKNLMFDAFSGKPLLVSVTNDFDRPIYSYEFNASWAYEGMGNAYKNDRAKFTFNINGSGDLDLTSGPNAGQANTLLFPGDEIYVVNGSSYFKCWVTKVVDGNTANIVGENGSTLSSVSGVTGLVIKSGRTNQQSVSSGAIASLSDPTAPGSRTFSLFADYKTAILANPTGSTFSFYSTDCSDPDHNYHYTASFNSTTNEVLISRTDPACSIHVKFSSTINSSNWKNYYFQKAGTRVYAYLPGNPNIQATGDYLDECGVTECMDNVLQASSAVFKDNWSFDYVDVGDPSVAYFGGGSPSHLSSLSTPNGYRVGTKGIWRAQQAWAYQTDRKQNPNPSPDVNQTKIQTDGTFNDFVLFDWSTNLNSATGLPIPRNKKWTMANEVTRYNPYGFEVENKNAIGIYSSALYGYNNMVQTGITANASYYEAGFDGFEDYTSTLTNYPASAAHGHIQLTSSSSIPLNRTVAHTGKASVELGSSQTISMAVTNAPGGYYFQTTPGEKYTVSVWFKTNGKPQIAASSVTSSEMFTDNIKIEGWQKVELNFVAASSTASIQFSVSGASGTSYLDDIRVQPFRSTMKTFVYNPYNLWLMAELDGQNYATFYNYDEEGTLVQVKKETVNGVQTLKTTRSNIKQ
ncbi:MAG: hypothetical protein JST26_07970 [Bacteroidetes bacterium]|nr:hypothetical protein [Bacteroidota bacterium]